ncbi:hypothetical protein OR16_28824 [Cupriavidus basilensis OR16]|uniref:Uncharacterized protein n=1 Tax=Cupriavidus basilensis OR16 TaxID=1127483 RepID=H1SC35_9BURK|nr:hypothetical protein [Cupriavidus basilensis]EHP39908.1 hypothetical protein OR16_28824 [Cupriavidus basilensis OR16]
MGARRWASRLTLALAGLLALLCVPVAWAGMEVRRADGVEIITSRPAPEAVAGRAGGGTKGGEPAAPNASGGGEGRRPQARGAEVQDMARPPTGRAEVTERGGGGGAGASLDPLHKRLRATEAVLQEQISEYNRALLAESAPETLEPLEDAIGRTLDQIDVLVRNARARVP